MKTKIIYVITQGEYSDYSILGACSTKEEADLFVEKYGGEIEEIKNVVPYIKSGWDFYQVDMREDGSVQRCEKERYPYWQSSHFWSPAPYYSSLQGTPQNEWVFRTSCWAKDSQHAIKIANERRVQTIAANAWGDNEALKRFPWCREGIA